LIRRKRARIAVSRAWRVGRSQSRARRATAGGRLAALHLVVRDHVPVHQVHVCEQRMHQVELMHTGACADRRRTDEQHG
jgi:hypothetical protein